MQLELALIENGEETKRYPIDRDEILVGRSRDADIVIDDKRVSRTHVRLRPDREGLSAEDLGSRNGIRINGELAQAGWLNVGDLLEVGGHRFLVTSPRGASEDIPDASPAPAAGPAVPRGKNGSGRSLLAWAKVGELHHLVFDPPALWKELAKVVLGNVAGRRCFFLARPPGEDALRVLAMHSVKGGGEGPSPNAIVLERAWRENEATRLNPSERGLDVDGPAIVAAPLSGRDQTIGVLYVDTGREDGDFSEDDLGMMKRFGKIFGQLVETALDAERRLGLAKIGGAQAVCARGAEFIAALAERESDAAGSQAARDLTGTLRLYGAAENGASEPVNMKTLVGALVEDLETEYGAKTVELESSEGLPIFAYADEDAVKGALNVLLSDRAAAAHAAGTRVTVAVFNTAAGCIVRVTSRAALEPVQQTALEAELVDIEADRPVDLRWAAAYRAITAQGGAVSVSANGETVLEVRLPNRDA